MNILVSVNSKFLVPLKILLYSLYTSQKTKCRIYLLNVHLTREEVQDLAKYCETLCMDLISQDMPGDVADTLRRKESILKEQSLSIETYTRLFAPFLFPDVSRLLWLDADCIVKKDLSSFYNQDLEGYATAACDHSNWILPQVPEFSHYEYPKRKEKPEHFNAGVLLLNLENCRRIKGFQKESMEYIIRTSKESFFPFFDQSILNYLFPPNRVKWENPLIYNCCANKYWTGGFGDNPALYPVVEESAILHFCSPSKPWELLQDYDPKLRKYWLDLYCDANRKGLL